MYENLFMILSFTPGPFWLILFFLPMNKKAMQAFDIYLILLSSIFATLTIPIIPELLPILASPKLLIMQQFLTSERGTVGTWNHMILGDLWIGRWIALDSVRNKVSWFIRFPILILILFFGPVGLFFYFIYRILFLKKIYFFNTNNES